MVRFDQHRYISFGTASANSMESDLGCTSRIFFDNVALTLHNETPTSQKNHANTIACVIAAKQKAINEVKCNAIY